MTGTGRRATPPRRRNPQRPRTGGSSGPPRTATPSYLGTDFDACPPGHRFTIYGALWTGDWTRVRHIQPNRHLRQFGAFPTGANELRKAVVERQEELAASLSGHVRSFASQSVAPFVTGTGIEHPLENGMAFLNPYGLPYLPGSGVKGVLRRAAEELARTIAGVRWSGTSHWTDAAVSALFGKQPPPGSDDATRGALTFWDVFPLCAGLSVDIMNPHYGPYYAGTEAPHDAGNPVPVFFLTVPERTRFVFHVQCDPRRLCGAPGLAQQWPELLAEAFDHAFDWLGFGAKTAVGYGHMQRDSEEENRLTERAAEQRKRTQARQDARSLPEDAAWIMDQRSENRWSDLNQNNRFLDDVEDFLEHKKQLSTDAYELLAEEITVRWKGILENPDAVGKKSKPKYRSPRARKLAKTLLNLRP